MTQEVFIRASHGLASFSGRSEFATWLHRIAMNCAKSFLIRRARRATSSLETAPEPVAPCGDRPDYQAAGGEMDEHIRSALAQLSPKLRAAVTLTILQDIPLSQAARIEECALATLYWRVHEARRQLKHLLTDALS